MMAFDGLVMGVVATMSVSDCFAAAVAAVCAVGWRPGSGIVVVFGELFICDEGGCVELDMVVKLVLYRLCWRRGGAEVWKSFV